MKVRIAFRRTLGIAAIAFVLGSVLVFLLFMSDFLSTPWKPTTWLIFGFYLSLFLAVFIMVTVLHYYVIENKGIVVHRAGKPLLYKYKEVIYIDRAYSEKHKTVAFMMDTGAVRYLTFDKQGKIYEEMVKRCKNVLSEEEFKSKYPKIKF